VASSAPTPTGWNRLALMSFLLSLVFPAGGVTVQMSGGLFHPDYVSTPPAYDVGLALLFASFLTVPAAILTGHSALDVAKRGVYQWPLRGLAIIGLVLGYGAFATFFIGIIVVFWLLAHLRFHIVF
jgi:hypothetical protein